MGDPASHHAFPGVTTPPRTPSGVRGFGVPSTTRVRRLLALTGAEQSRFLVVLVLVATVRGALWLLPSSVSLRFVRRIANRQPRPVPARCPDLDQLTWAVSAASRLLPHATCLTQAVSAQLLLAHFGYASQLCLGVAKSSEGVFAAHAWVESGGQIVIGGQNSAGFTPLRAPRTAPPAVRQGVST